jgi:hypothetical protein
VKLAEGTVVDLQTAQIALKAEAHRVRAEINDSLAADRLAFDDSPEAERLRRFDLACGRGLARSLDSLVKLRRDPELFNFPLSMDPGPLSAAGDTVESSAPPNETNEPTAACEIVTNEPMDRENVTNEPTDAREIATIEPTDACEIVSNCPTLAAIVEPDGPTYMQAQNATNETMDACEIVPNELMDRENVTNEPTDANQEEGKDLNRSRIKIKSRIKNEDRPPIGNGENLTNEPTAPEENATNEATVDRDIVTNEPTDANQAEGEDLNRSRINIKIESRIKNEDRRPIANAENVTNEPTDARENVTNEPTLAADVGLESPTYLKTPEQNSTIESALTALRVGGPSIVMAAGAGRGDDGEFGEEIDRQKSVEWNRAGSSGPAQFVIRQSVLS